MRKKYRLLFCAALVAGASVAQEGLIRQVEVKEKE